MTVIDPTIRLSWIKDRWSIGEAEKARKTILDLVGRSTLSF